MTELIMLLWENKSFCVCACRDFKDMHGEEEGRRVKKIWTVLLWRVKEVFWELPPFFLSRQEKGKKYPFLPLFLFAFLFFLFLWREWENADGPRESSQRDGPRKEEEAMQKEIQFSYGNLEPSCAKKYLSWQASRSMNDFLVGYKVTSTVFCPNKPEKWA